MSVGVNKAYIQRILDSIAASRMDEVILSQFGVSLTNEDLSSLRPGCKLTSRLANFFVEYFRALGDSTRAITKANRKLVYVLQLADLAELMKGDIAVGSDINSERWRKQSQQFRGKGKTIFHEFHKVIAPIRLSPEHIVVAEIRNGSIAGSGLAGSFPRPTTSEILLFDSNHKEFRHLHNSLYLIIKRYIYEELLEKSGNTQSECYQDSLQYLFRRGSCTQQLVNTYLLRERDPDSLLFPLKNLQVLVNSEDIESTVHGPKEIEGFRYELFQLLLNRASLSSSSSV